MVTFLSMVSQSGHFEGGMEAGTGAEEGSCPDTGSKAGQEMEACLTPQNMQWLGWDLETMRDFPACVDLSSGAEGRQIGSHCLTLLSRFCLSLL